MVDVEQGQEFWDLKETTLLSGVVSLETLDIHVKHMIPAFSTLGTIRSLERK